MQKRRARLQTAAARRLQPGPHLPAHICPSAVASLLPAPPPGGVPPEYRSPLLALQKLVQV